jgi:formate/nitrite transporter FocA (FNT family)
MRAIFRRKPAPPPANPAPQKDLERPSAQDIYEQVANNARQELGRSSTSLAISGLAGGIFMGLSALGNAIAISLLTPPGGAPSASTLFIGKMFYPLGFIVVILGRSQLFTENTLYPVALVLAEQNHFWKTLRLWAVVLPFNVLGALAFATLATSTHAMTPAAVQSLSQLGMEATSHPAATIFWSGVMGGWIIASVAWLVSGSHSITGSVMIIWMLTFVVGLGNFAHCIAASGEVFATILTGRASWMAFPMWFLPAVAGNICGGVGMVTLLEYGQVIIGKDAEAEALPSAPKEESKPEEPKE